MYSSPDQYAIASKVLVESQIAAFAAMTAIATRCTEAIIALNLAAAKASTEDSVAAARELMTLKDPQVFFLRVSALAKARGEKLAAYNSHLLDVGTSTKAEFGKIANAQLSEAQNKVTAFVNGLGRRAPAVLKT